MKNIYIMKIINYQNCSAKVPICFGLYKTLVVPGVSTKTLAVHRQTCKDDEISANLVHPGKGRKLLNSKGEKATVF